MGQSSKSEHWVVKIADAAMMTGEVAKLISFVNLPFPF